MLFPALIFLLGALMACNTQAEPKVYSQQLTEMKEITDPPNQQPGEYVYLAWLGDSLVVQYEDYALGGASGFAFAHRLWRLSLDGSVWQEVEIPVDPQCIKWGYEEPTRLPNSQLGYILRCMYDPNLFVDRLLMMSYDIQTQKTAPLINYPLPSQHSSFGIYSWSPDMSKGIIDDRQGLSERLYWLYSDHWEYLDLNFSRAISPVWSPSGAVIAFWGAPEQGLRGRDKAKALFNLYLLEPTGTIRKSLLEGFQYPKSIAWSPDGRWLAFTGRFSEDQEEGIWLTDVNEARVYLIAQGSFRHLTWSEDGQQVAAIQLQDGSSRTELVLLQIESLLRNNNEQK